MWSTVLLIFLPLSTGFAHSRYTADYDLWLQSVPRRPVDLATDVINDLGVRILQQYVGHGNVAFSPTGAGFVLAALYEGSAGTGGRQIADALGLPRDRDVTRIGFRDIHRRLRTYLNADGFLGGLTLNRENTRLRSDYEDILRFYGFNFEDLDADGGNNGTAPPDSIPPAAAADAKLATAPSTPASTPTSAAAAGRNPETTSAPPSGLSTPESVPETTAIASATSSASAPSDVATSQGPDATGATSAGTEAATPGVTEDATTAVAEGATTAVAESPTTAVAEDATIAVAGGPAIAVAEAATTAAAEAATTAAAEAATTAVAEGATTAAAEAITTAVAEDATTAVAETTFPEISEATTSSAPAATDASNVTPARLRESTTSRETTLLQETTTNVPVSLESSTPAEASVSEISLPTTSPDPAPETPASSTDAAAVTEPGSGTTPESGTEITEESESGSSEVTMTSTTTTTTSAEKVLEESGTTIDSSESDSSSSEASTTEGDATSEESTTTKGSETGTTVPPETTSEATEGSVNRMRRRYTRSPRGYFSSFPEEGIWMQDLGIWRVHSADSSGEANVRDSTELSFLVNGCDVAVVTASSYTAVLPFAYFPSLRAVALEFPLDDPRYNILLFLPTERVNTRRLTRDLGNESLRLLRKQLQSTWVRATIPSFMLRGFVTLTPFLQRMGIRDVFEPRTADLSPMTPDLGVYARDVQQSIGVNIRNYMKPDRTNSRESDQFERPMNAPPRRDSYRFLRPGNGLFERAGPVSFTAQHPFLYFIIDAETSVTLIAGRVDDPLNSRIL